MTTKQSINEKLAVGEVVFDKDAKAYVRILELLQEPLENGETVDIAHVEVVRAIKNSRFKEHDRLTRFVCMG